MPQIRMKHPNALRMDGSLRRFRSGTTLQMGHPTLWLGSSNFRSASEGFKERTK